MLKKAYNGKKLSILGDSISTFKGKIPSGYEYFYPEPNRVPNVLSVNDLWWFKLLQETGLKMLKNCSWSGCCVTGNTSSTTSAASAASTKRVNDLSKGGTKPDIIICYVGINDLRSEYNITIGNYKGTTPPPADGICITNFSDAYGIMLYKVLKTYPNAEVYCCSLLDNLSEFRCASGNYPIINHNGVALKDINAKIKQISKNMNVNGNKAHFIDLHACGVNKTNILSLLPDRTHPSAEAHILIEKYIKNALLKHYKLSDQSREINPKS